MSETPSNDPIESALNQYDAGRIDRRELLRKLGGVGAAAGLAGLLASLGTKEVFAALSNDERRILFSRLINQPVTIANGRVTLQPLTTTNRLFDTNEEHRQWLFGEAFTSGGQTYYDRIGLRQFSETVRNAIEDRTANNNPGTAMPQNDPDVIPLMNAVMAADALGVLKEGTVPTSAMNYDGADLYGLVRQKLHWVCEHCAGDAIVAAMRFLRINGWFVDETDPKWDEFRQMIAPCGLAFSDTEWTELKEKVHDTGNVVCTPEGVSVHTGY